MRWYKQADSGVRGQLIGQKLTELGLSMLGTRHAKAGEQYGTPDGARRIAVGARDLMLNYLTAEAEMAYGRWQENSRWNMFKSFSIKQIYEAPTRDAFLQKLVDWAKQGPTMKDVRRFARDNAGIASGDTSGRGERGFATGLEKSTNPARSNSTPAAPVPPESQPPQQTPPDVPASGI